MPDSSFYRKGVHAFIVGPGSRGMHKWKARVEVCV
jgi:hypothetical protein